MKRALLVAGGMLSLFAAVILVGFWEPWASKEREHELAWLRAVAAWSDVIDDRLDGGDFYPAANCADSYSVDVGEPPERMTEADRLARLACRSLSRWVETEEDWPPPDWPDMLYDVIGELIEQRRYDAATESERLVRHASRLGRVEDPEVYCWSLSGWEKLNEEWALVESDEFRLDGFAAPEVGTIDLAPHVCEPLHRFFGGSYAPNLNEASLDLATALVTLAHEAEHLRSPQASEAEVECVAIQRVRDLVHAAGRPRSYEDLMAGLAWDVGYPDLTEEYRTSACHNGGDLDVRPDTSVWP
ncbi:MAG: hypothetical protein ACRDNB_10850 [Gaiellaceae bacterium]